MKISTEAGRERIVAKAKDAMTALTVDEADGLLTLDWDVMLRHQTFYSAAFRLSVLQAKRIAIARGGRASAGCEFRVDAAE